MRRLMLVPLAVVLVATACSSNNKASVSSTPTSAAPAASSTSDTGTSAGATIQIKNFAYNDLTVAPGTTITVKNNDDAAHTVTAKDGSFKSGSVDSGSPKTFTAPTKAGTYTYGCDFHPSMKGTLTVS